MIRVLTSDECGLVKLVDLTKRHLLSSVGGGDEQTRKREVVRTAWLPSSQEEEDDESLPLSTSRVATLTRSGVVEVWDTTGGAGALGKRLHRCKGAGEGGVYLASRRGRFVTVASDGNVRIFSHSAVEAEATSAPSNQWLLSSSSSYWSPPSTFRAAENAVCAQLHRGGTHLALGGKEVEVSLWDINQGKQVWQARNVENDFLDMRVPVWVRAVTFLRDFGSTDKSSSHSHLIAMVSAYKHLRIYDTRSSDARPIKSTEMGDYAFTALALSGDGRSLITGDASGILRRIDASSLDVTGAFQGPSGSVRCIDSHPTLPYVASVSLDRCLWIHNVHTRQLVRRIYLKQRLNSVLFERPGGFAVPPPPPAEGLNLKGGKYYMNQVQLNASHEASRERQGADGGGLVPDFAPAGAGRKAKLIKIIENSKRLAAEASGHGQEKGPISAADEDWQELDRRAALAAAAAQGDDGEKEGDEEMMGEEEEEDAEDISDMSDGSVEEDGVEPFSRKRKSREEEDDEDDDEEEDDDDEDDDDEDEDDDDEDEDDDDEDEDDEDEDEDDDDDESSGSDDEDNTSSLVDSRSVARSLMKQTEDVKFAESRRKGVGKGGSKLSVKASARAVVASRLARKQKEKSRR